MQTKRFKFNYTHKTFQKKFIAIHEKIKVCNSCILMHDMMFYNTCILLCGLFMFKVLKLEFRFLIYFIVFGLGSEFETNQAS